MAKRNRAAYMRQWRRDNPERWAEIQRWAKIKYLYGLTRDDYAALLDSQGGVCAGPGCDATPTNVDHDHSCCPGQRQARRTCGQCIRGLVCSSCNRRDVLALTGR